MIEAKGYKTTPIYGDLAVSRNAEIGRDVDIQGKARVAGSLKVEGFLDAPHIKGSEKGLFNSVEELAKEYPNPRPGWFAIVLDATDKEKGLLYKAENMGWVATTDEAKPYEFIKDSINVFASKNELIDAKEGLEAAIDDTAGALAEMITKIEGNALQYNKIGFSVYADKIELYAKNISDNGVRFDEIPAATAEKAGVMSAEDKRNLNNSTVKVITWNNDTDPSNINDFTEAGVYEIKGEHTRNDDNLPFGNTGGGHTFHARLEVLDSSIAPEGQSDDICITQKLTLSNRVAGDGDVYIRTGRGANKQSITWEKWGKQQQNIEVGEVTNLDNLIDNGIYSGVWTNGHLNNYPLTFVCVVINDYFIGISPRRVSQFLYGLSNSNGSTVYQTRVWDDAYNKWSDWEIINKAEIDSLISTKVEELDKAVNDKIETLIEGADPNTIDSIKDLINWVNTHGSTTNDILARLDDNEDNIEKIKREYVVFGSFDVQPEANQVEIDYSGADDTNAMFIPAATEHLAGVMSAEDKKKLLGMQSTIEDAIAEESKATDEKIAKEKAALVNGDTIVGQAREIHSRNGKTVSDSFLARTTAGSGTVGNGVATLKSVGGNIVKNLVDGSCKNALFSKELKLVNNNGIVTATTTGGTVAYTQIYYEGVSIVANHTYYTMVILNNHGYATRIATTRNIQISSKKENKWQLASGIHQSTAESAVDRYQCRAYIRTELSDTLSMIEVANWLVIDLTEMFGEERANQMTKEECDKLFGTMDALPQGLNFAKPTKLKSTGYNQSDQSKVLANKGIENGAIVDKVGSNIAIVPCLPCNIGVGENNGYCIHGAFDEGAEKVYLTPINPLEVDGELYLCELTKDANKGTYVPQIKGYMIVEVPNATDLCVHFLWSEDCDRNAYEPYYESKVELPAIPEMSEYGLAGIQSSGTLACDEINLVKGVYRKKIRQVELSQYGWWGHKTGTCIYYCDLGKNTNGINDALLCERYSIVKYGGNLIDSIPNKCMMFGGGKYLYIRDDDYTTNTDFKNSLTGLYAYYAIATPEEYPLPKVNNNYTSSDYGVEQFDGAVPCNANNLYYMRSLAGETRNFLDRLMAGLGTTDATAVADRILAVVNPVVEPTSVEPEIPIEP